VTGERLRVHSPDMDLETTVAVIAPPLLAFCRGLERDAGFAEEAAQDGLAALVMRWRRRGPPDCPQAFAFAVARRRLRRAQWRRRWLGPAPGSAENGFERRSPDASPETTALSRLQLEHTLAALDRLPARDREALLVVAVGELDLETGARALGVSVSALKMRIHRARQRLKSSLEEL
jgi:RNA polymerase sigma factor (sigma-70 family)